LERVKSVEPTSPSRQSQHEQRRQSSCQLLSSARSRYLSVIGRRHPAHSSARTAVPPPAPSPGPAEAEGASAGESGTASAAAVTVGDAIPADDVFSVVIPVVGDFSAATDSRYRH